MSEKTKIIIRRFPTSQQLSTASRAIVDEFMVVPKGRATKNMSAKIARTILREFRKAK